MNYEELLKNIQTLEKEMKDTLALQQKLYKNLCKNMEKGDLKNWRKESEALFDAQKRNEETLSEMQQVVKQFDSKEYLESGAFAVQMLEYCEQFGLDIKGESPTYEMFPYKIKIDAESLDIFVDKKKVQSVRPYRFVSDVKAGREKLLKASFNASTFANEMSAAYDLLLKVQNKGVKDKDVLLSSLYKYLTPMRRFRKDYDQQNYAFDLARLYSSDTKTLDDGRKLQFGTSREIKQAIRILDEDGQEQFLSTIRFYN